MKGYNGWTYTPYQPLMFPSGDIYICRVAPQERAVHIEWLGGSAEVWVRKRGEGTFEKAGVGDGEYTISGLEKDTDYEFYVKAGEKKSRLRLARTGKSVGTVINYLHPEDGVYSFSGHSLCSPSFVHYPDGTYLASMDVFEGGKPQNLTLLFRSDDDGATWHYVTDLMPCFWGKLFLHKGELYMLANSTEYGDLLIGKSTDKGKTFTTPTVLLRGSCDMTRPGVHRNPQNVMYYGGRIWETLEWGAWSSMEHPFQHAAMVMSAEEDADLLDPESWHFSEPLPYDPAWPGVARGMAAGTIEGTLVVTPDGRLQNIMRYQTTKDSDPTYGLALCYDVDTDDPDAPLRYSHAMPFPANRSKFMIKRDAHGRYYSLATRITDPSCIDDRRLLSLMASDDLVSWTVVCDLLDARDQDAAFVGFQYVDFEFDGDDIVYQCRTALNGAFNFHDANYATFHRVKNYRAL